MLISEPPRIWIKDQSKQFIATSFNFTPFMAWAGIFFKQIKLRFLSEWIMIRFCGSFVFPGFCHSLPIEIYSAIAPFFFLGRIAASRLLPSGMGRHGMTVWSLLKLGQQWLINILEKTMGYCMVFWCEYTRHPLSSWSWGIDLNDFMLESPQILRDDAEVCSKAVRWLWKSPVSKSSNVLDYIYM